MRTNVILLILLLTPLTALVTGASSGLGKAVAIEFPELARVVSA